MSLELTRDAPSLQLVSSSPGTAAAGASLKSEFPSRMSLRRGVGFVLGPLILTLTLLLPPPEGLSLSGWHTAGAACLIAMWWITEAIPIPATSLLPLVLFPLLGIVDIRGAAAPFASPIIYLFLGGFLLALAMERWNLHRRVALALIGLVGTKPKRIIAGFLGTSALLSMWVSNTATTLMMLPIALSVASLLEAQSKSSEEKRVTGQFSLALLLIVAYGATIGGLGTLIGTPPNALLAAYLSQTYGYHIGFGQWMLIGVPVVLLGLPIGYLLLTRIIFRVPSADLPGIDAVMRTEKAKLGPVTYPEVAVAAVFILTALGWVFQPLIARAVPMLTDTVIALVGGLTLFLIPARPREGVFLMDWESCRKMPWDVFLLFGGGLSLAAAMETHGVAAYFGSAFPIEGGLPVIAFMLLVALAILLLTELTSNTATAATFLPIVATVAILLGESPLLLLVPAAMAANCSFMLPVGTPPNAIVFATGRITLPEMAKAGIWMNVAFTLLITGMVYFLGPLVFGIEPQALPEWVTERP